MKWINRHIFDFISIFRNSVYIDESLTIGSATDIEPKINLLNDENSVEIGIANATNDMVTGSADGDLVINSVGDHKIILAQNDAEVITIENTATVSFADDIFIGGDLLTISSLAATGSRIRLYEGTDNGTNTLTLTTPAAIGTSFSLVFPDGFGSSGQVLTTDGNNPAALSWASITATGALNSGSITSGFGNIDNGSSTLDTGALTATTITVPSRVYALPGTNDGDHTAGDVVYFGGTTSMTAGKCYYFTGAGVWALSNGGADATATGLLAIALGAASNTDGMLLRGMVTPYGPAGTDDHGKKVYLRVQDGTLTTAIPTGSGQFVRIVGYMLDDVSGGTDAIYFCPDNTYVEIA